ncbi:MAG: hypothetical protein KAI97_07220, partial [Gemmatimonadetes bacterium]|nr:hypothetical protein [Gemmatimonadota bacterium]
GGVNQSVWRTDLDIHNTGSRSHNVEIELLRADQANLMPMRASVMLAPYASVRYVDAIDSLFGTAGVGSIRILAEADAVRSSSRTYNDEGDGTFGQGIPADRAGDALGFGDVGRLVGLSAAAGPSSGFRTNIGVVNVGASSITVNVDLYAGDGSFVETVTVELDAYEQVQVNGVFSEATEVGYAEVWTETPGGRFLAYGSVVDNISGDPTYVAVR